VHPVTPKHKLLEFQHRARLPIFYSALCEQGISNCLYITNEDLIGRMEFHYQLFVPDTLESDLSLYLPGMLYLPQTLEVLEPEETWSFTDPTVLKPLRTTARFTGVIGYYSTSHRLGLRSSPTGTRTSKLSANPLRCRMLNSSNTTPSIKISSV
jgi:hypothetical protein